ncbi:T9SS type A sorting domain-containing protein [Dyadobacter sp. 676]|uniref:T9SS type A sorting domain-containing protein n=1 Tax=Dyadobacter sp. 676 TaxID=3088362 RepID=A0AAU8FFX5_9BACT
MIGYIHYNHQSAGIDLNHFTSTHQGSNSGSYYWTYSNPTQGIKSAADVHSNITIVGNTIDNCFFGIRVTDGYLISGANAFAGTGLVIGRAGEGNTITNFGPASGVAYGGTYHAAVAGISVGGQKDFSIEHNNVSGATGGTISDNLRSIAGIWAGMSTGGGFALPRTATGLFRINNNTISNIDLTTNTTASLKYAFGIIFAANDDATERAKPAGNIEINNNNISNLKGRTGDVVGINSYWYADAPTVTLNTWRREGFQNGNNVSITGNTITGLSRLSHVRSGLLSAINWKHSSKNLYINGNNISNFVLGNTTNTPIALTAGMHLIYTYSYLNLVTRDLLEIKNNNITNNDILAPAGARNPVSASMIFAQSGGISSIVQSNTISGNELYNAANSNSVFHTDLIRVQGKPRTGPSTVTIDNNQLTDNVRTGLYASSGYGYQAQFRGIVADYTGALQTKIISNNLIENMSQTANAANHAYSYSMIRGIYTKGSYTIGHNVSIFKNTIRNLSGMVAASSKLIGIYDNVYDKYPLAGIAAEYYNKLDIYGNNITNLDAGTLSTGYQADGNYATGPVGITTFSPYVDYNTTQNIYNNFISELKAPAMRSRLAINGIIISGSIFRSNIYHNTIVLGAADGGSAGALTSTATSFGVTGILIASYYYNTKTYLTDYRNNIVHVNAIAKGTAANMAVRNFSVTAAKKVPLGTAKTSSGNVYFVNAAPANYIYGQGSVYNAAGTGGIRNSFAFGGATANAANYLVNDPDFNIACGIYKTFMAGADKESYAELDPVNNTTPKPSPFVNSGSAPDNLKITSGATSAVFNAKYIGTPVNVNQDYFGVGRGTGKVTAGAHETSGIIAPYIAGVIAFDYKPINDSICGGNKPLKVTITPPDGQMIATGAKAPRLYYRRVYNNAAYAAVDANVMPANAAANSASGPSGWRWVNPTGNNGNDYDFTIDLSILRSATVTNPVYTIEYFVIAETSDGTVCSWTSGDWSANVASTCPGTVELESYPVPPVPLDPLATTLDDNSVQDNYTIFRGQDLNRGIELVNNGSSVKYFGTGAPTPNTAAATTCIGGEIKAIAHYYVNATGDYAVGSQWQFQVANDAAFTNGLETFNQGDSIFTYTMAAAGTKYVRAFMVCGGTPVPNTNTAYASVTASETPVNTSAIADKNSCVGVAQSSTLTSTANPANMGRFYWLTSPKSKVFNVAPVNNTTGTATLNVTPDTTAHSGQWKSYVTSSTASVLGDQGYRTSQLDGTESGKFDIGSGVKLSVNSFVKLNSVKIKDVDDEDNTPSHDDFFIRLYSADGFLLYSFTNTANIADGATITATLPNWYIAPGEYLLVLEVADPSATFTNSLAFATPDFPISSPATTTPAFQVTGGVSDLAYDSESGMFSYSETTDYNYFFDLNVNSYCTSNPTTFNWTINPASCCASSPLAGVIADGTVSAELATNNCKFINGWYYYFDPAAPSKLLAAVDPNGNTFNPASVVIYNTGTSSDADHLETDGSTKTAEVMPYMLQIVQDGTLSTNGGVKVRMFYPAAQKAIIDAYPYKTWFKLSGSKQDVLDNLTVDDVVGKDSLVASSTGLENGIPYVQFDGIQIFSTFGFLGSKTNPLPVTLVSFKVSKEGSTASLNWQTTEETNSKVFEVQRSADGKKWTAIGTRQAKGESNVLVTYSFTDDRPLGGRSFYRLKMIDFDDTFTYSRIQSINFADEISIEIYPNPAAEKVNIKANDLSGISQVEIVAASGVKVYQSDKVLSGSIDVKHLPAGMYLLVLKGIDGTRSTHKLVIRR